MQQLNLYGNQPGGRAGVATPGYGPAGQTYNMANPVVMTSSGVRPASVVAASMRQNQQQQSPSGGYYHPGNKPGMTPGGGSGSPMGGGTARPGGSGNPLLDMLGGSIQTSITPQNIYSPQQTNEAVNQAVASSTMELPWLQNRFVGSGMNVNSPATISRAMVPYAQGLAQGQTASAQIPLQDITANAQHWSAGEQGRESEGLDWARLMTSAQGINQNARMNTLQSVLGLLGSFV